MVPLLVNRAVLLWLSISLILIGVLPVIAAIPAGPEEEILCGGVQTGKVSFVRDNSRIFETDLFPVRLGSSVTAVDSAYIHETLLGVLPSLLEILGQPVGLDTLTIVLGEGTPFYALWNNLLSMYTPYPRRGQDDDRDGLVDEDPYDGRDNDGDGRIDEDAVNSPNWDNLFIHELPHAWQDGILSRSPSWLAEGMAEAGRHFVSEHATLRQVGRDFRHRKFAARMMAIDLENAGAEQILGGSQSIYYRYDSRLTYRAAGGAVILACYAQMMAGQESPHPLERLTTALHADIESGAPARPLPAVISEAWTAPVDGVAPAGRWLCTRSIVNRWVRDGAFLLLWPGVNLSCLNPSALYRMFFVRDGFDYQTLAVSNPLVFTSTTGRQSEGTGVYHQIPPPDHGAYLVETEEEHDGSPVRGRTWMLNTPSGKQMLDSGEGIAVIFVGRDGLPVEVPDLEVNGRIVEQVPGGVVVAPTSALSPEGMLWLRSGDRTLGMVTVPGPMSRVVPLFIDDPEPPEVVSWRPYRPVVGDTLTVTLRYSRSALVPDEPSVLARLTGLDIGWQAEAPLLPAEEPDLWTARLPVLDGPDVGLFDFRAEDSYHGASHTSAYYALACEIAASARAVVVGVEITEDVMALTFDRAVVADDYTLEMAVNPAGPWQVGTAAASDPGWPEMLHWDVPRLQHASRYARIVETAVGGEVVCSFALGATAPRTRIAVRPLFPNPSADGVRVALELDTNATIRLEVYDIRGRRVSGPSDYPLAPGQREIHWNGLAGGRPLAAGTYILRLRGPSLEVTQKVLLLRDRP